MCEIHGHQAVNNKNKKIPVLIFIMSIKIRMWVNYFLERGQY